MQNILPPVKSHRRQFLYKPCVMPIPVCRLDCRAGACSRRQSVSFWEVYSSAIFPDIIYQNSMKICNDYGGRQPAPYNNPLDKWQFSRSSVGSIARTFCAEGGGGGIEHLAQPGKGLITEHRHQCFFLPTPEAIHGNADQSGQRSLGKVVFLSQPQYPAGKKCSVWDNNHKYHLLVR